MSQGEVEEFQETDYLLKRLIEAGTELVIVMGRRNGDDPGAYWVDTILSVTGRTPGYPTLGEALENDLLLPDSGRYVVPFDVEKAVGERRDELRDRTQNALRTLRGRQQPGRNRFASQPEAGGDLAQHYAQDTRLKFERVYDSARKALDRGDKEMAVMKCRAALELLKSKNLYGAAQEQLVRKLEAAIKRMGLE